MTYRYDFKAANVTAFNDPYETWIVDDFILDDALDSVLLEWPSQDDRGWFRGRSMVGYDDNILEKGMLAVSDPTMMRPKTESLVRWLHSHDVSNVIGRITNIPGLEPDDTMRWSGIREMLPGGLQLIHSDARINPVSMKRKHLTAMLYLNKGWERDHEGCLELWDDAMTTCVRRIEPLYNRLVLFVNSDTSYHGVPCVNRSRKALTFSIMKGFGTPGDREYARFVARPSDPDIVSIVGERRSRGGA